MNSIYMLNKIKNDCRYWLEYDYLVHSSNAELCCVNELTCLLGCEESYCMIEYNREQLDNVVDILRTKMIGCKEVLISFNVERDIKVEEEIKYLESNQYRFLSVYDSYVINEPCSFNNVFTTNSHVVELTSSNIDRYKYDHCNIEIQYRPPFEKLIDIFVRKNQGRVIAYVDDDYILGYLSYTNIFDNVNDVDYIYVAETCRQSGIGTLLGSYYASKTINENKHALWSNATEISSKTAIRSGFKWCCKHMSFYKKMDN